MALFSKRAREERALAAERRMQALQGKVASTSNLTISPLVEDVSDTEDEKQDSETDYDRHRTLLEVVEEKDLDALRATMIDSAQDFLLPCVGNSGQSGVCITEGPRDSAVGGFGQVKTSLGAESSTRPRKKRKTSPSTLNFAPSRTATVMDSEATKAKCEVEWNCMVCTL